MEYRYFKDNLSNLKLCIKETFFIENVKYEIDELIMKCNTKPIYLKVYLKFQITQTRM